MLWLRAMFMEGGWAMYPILLLGIFLVCCAVAHALVAHRGTMIASGVLGSLMLAVGVEGTLHGRHVTEAALKFVGDSMREAVRQQGYMESRRPTQFALIFLAVAIVPLIIGEIRRRRAAERPKALAATLPVA